MGGVGFQHRPHHKTLMITSTKNRGSVGTWVLVSSESIWHAVRAAILEAQTYTSSLISNVMLGTQNPEVS